MDKNLLKIIVEMYKKGEISQTNANALLNEIKTKKDDIAIVGLGCKTPVSDDYHDLWETIKGKKSHVQVCPEGRMELFGNLLGENANNSESYHHGGLLSDLGWFDYKLFGMTQEEASILDPMQRVMLEVAYRTLEDGGYLGERKCSSDTGVFIGANFTSKQIISYLSLVGRYDFPSMMANWTNGVATRISNIFDLRGVSTVVENSCIASIIAIYDACNMLKSGKLKMALVGSINSLLIPDRRFSLNKVFEHEPDVVSRPYDDNPGGNYVGVGAAAILLKRLDDAIEDGDKIWGVIKSSYVNNNGAKANFTQSNAEMIAEAIREAFVEARVSPEDIGYIEGEGYCEKLEQALEVLGLIQGFERLTKRKQYCALGASSANIGYSEVSVGMFNTIICILAMKNKQIPPIYCFDYPSELFELENSPFYINDQLKEWKVDAGKKRLSAIFTQGFGGGNGFTILEESPTLSSDDEGEKKHLFTISAQSEVAFHQHLEKYIAFLKETDSDFSALCFTNNVCRPHYFPYRLAVIASTKEELVEQLIQWNETRTNTQTVFWGNVEEKKYEMKKKHETEIQNAIRDYDYEKIAEMYVDGYHISFTNLYPSRKRAVDLPQYQFDKSLCWLL